MSACKTQRQGQLKIFILLHFYLVELGEFKPALSSLPLPNCTDVRIMSPFSHQFALWILILQELNDA